MQFNAFPLAHGVYNSIARFPFKLRSIHARHTRLVASCRASYRDVSRLIFARYFRAEFRSGERRDAIRRCNKNLLYDSRNAAFVYFPCTFLCIRSTVNKVFIAESRKFYISVTRNFYFVLGPMYMSRRIYKKSFWQHLARS